MVNSRDGKFSDGRDKCLRHRLKELNRFGIQVVIVRLPKDFQSLKVQLELTTCSQGNNQAWHPPVPAIPGKWQAYLEDHLPNLGRQF